MKPKFSVILKIVVASSTISINPDVFVSGDTLYVTIFVSIIPAFFNFKYVRFIRFNTIWSFLTSSFLNSIFLIVPSFFFKGISTGLDALLNVWILSLSIHSYSSVGSIGVIIFL